MTKQSPFYLTKMMEVGTKHPVVARIAMGIPEILEKCEFSKQKKIDLTSLCFDITKDLVEAEKQAMIVIQEIEIIEKKLEETKPVVVPNVIDSVINIESTRAFLKFAKDALRSFAAMLGIIFDEGYKEPKFQYIRTELNKKLMGEHVEEPMILKILNHYYSFADNLVERRNVDEHHHYSKSFLHNYRIDKENDYLTIKRPSFWDGEPILEYLQNALPMLLHFIEESLIGAISLKLNQVLVIREIPEAQRNPNFPRRFRVDPYGHFLSQSVLKTESH